MRTPWAPVRVAAVASVAVLAGYLWRDALAGPERIGRFLPPEAHAQADPPVIYLPEVRKPTRSTGPSVSGAGAGNASGGGSGTPAG
ncbi:MAG: hypothetical protein ACRDNB_05790, partial [Gaiellaceae bacterium]